MKVMSEAKIKSNISNYSENIKYRPDIDGLRSIAIVLVVLYHAFPSRLPGGFVGVDIFFVISGYLISTIIFSHFDRGDFSYIGFYARRIRRIFPALIIVIACTMGVGWLVLSPTEYYHLGASSFASSFFIANLLDINNAGYFDVSNEYKQLLHMWSLSVEEQYYLLWPMIVAVLWRSRIFIYASMVILTSSFIISLLLSYSHIIIWRFDSATLAYYLPFSRLWELMIGSVLAFVVMRHPSVLQRHCGIQSVLGLGFIFLGVVLTTPKSAFPGLLALLPTLGAMLLITAGPGAQGNRLILANPLMVWIGLISYPLYLWHWPLLSYMAVMDGNAPTALPAAGVIVVSIFLAYATFTLIEKPLRFHARWMVSPIILCVILFVLGGAGLVIWAKDGIPHRAAPQLNAMDNVVANADGLLISECGLPPGGHMGIANCVSDKRGQTVFAVLGDSKAAALFPALVNQSSPRGRWLIIGGNGPFGAPTPVISDAPGYRKFKKMTIAATTAIATNPSIKVVVLVAAVRTIFQADDGSLKNLPNSLAADSTVPFDGLNDTIGRFVSAGKKLSSSSTIRLWQIRSNA